MNTFTAFYLLGALVAFILMIATIICDYIDTTGDNKVFVVTYEDILRYAVSIAGSWITAIVSFSIIIKDDAWLNKTAFTIKPKKK